MICTKCNIKTKVVDSRTDEKDLLVYRQRQCPTCKGYIYTTEYVSEDPKRVKKLIAMIKSDRKFELKNSKKKYKEDK